MLDGQYLDVYSAESLRTTHKRSYSKSMKKGKDTEGGKVDICKPPTLI